MFRIGIPGDFASGVSGQPDALLIITRQRSVRVSGCQLAQNHYYKVKCRELGVCHDDFHKIRIVPIVPVSVPAPWQLRWSRACPTITQFRVRSGTIPSSLSAPITLFVTLGPQYIGFYTVWLVKVLQPPGVIHPSYASCCGSTQLVPDPLPCKLLEFMTKDLCIGPIPSWLPHEQPEVVCQKPYCAPELLTVTPILLP